MRSRAVRAAADLGRCRGQRRSGPDPIVDGEAAAARDVTVFNEHLAFGLAVESVVPYGVPRGAIVDVAPVVDGKPGRDRVVLADFIPNNWSAWPNTYQKVEIVRRPPDTLSCSVRPACRTEHRVYP